jgi:hexosaminidase
MSAKRSSTSSSGHGVAVLGGTTVLVAALIAAPGLTATAVPRPAPDLAATAQSSAQSSALRAVAGMPTIIPKPVSTTGGRGSFRLLPTARIVASGPARLIGGDLARYLRPATGYRLSLVSVDPRPGDLTLRLMANPRGLAPDRFGEGYRLDVTRRHVIASARTTHGLFNAVQTIRQLLPARIDAAGRQHGPWHMPAVHVVDFPRFGYRGFMLDIARHYEPPSAVKRLLDRVAEYKINTFHLHLSDDQGFRIVIHGFPRLTRIGGQGSVGTDGRTTDPGGFWTQRQYKSVVAYAKARFISVVPEVDTPGHTNAIIMAEYNDASNPRLDSHPQDINCGKYNPPHWNYTGDVGYSALCPGSDNTWAILTAIIRQLTRMSSGRYYDLGGDEVPSTVLSRNQYAALVNTESGIVTGFGKTVMGWAEIAGAGTNVPRGTVAEYWNPASGSDPNTATATEAVAKRMKLVMAPATHAYLDQKYAPNVPANLGLTWACNAGCDVDQFYNWDPVSYVTGVRRSDVLGVEAAMWGETVRTLREVEYMVFPRLTAIAELGWSPRTRRTASSAAYHNFLTRLGAQGPRWNASRTSFYPSPEVPWQ